MANIMYPGLRFKKEAGVTTKIWFIVINQNKIKAIEKMMNIFVLMDRLNVRAIHATKLARVYI